MKCQLGLTKESFFNELTDKYPKAMKVFCDWIDEYKKVVGWEDLFSFEGRAVVPVYETDTFSGGSVLTGCYRHVDCTPKFHDLPYAMQLGIWAAFIEDKYNTPEPYVRLAFTSGTYGLAYAIGKWCRDFYKTKN